MLHLIWGVLVFWPWKYFIFIEQLVVPLDINTVGNCTVHKFVTSNFHMETVIGLQSLICLMIWCSYFPCLLFKQVSCHILASIVFIINWCNSKLENVFSPIIGCISSLQCFCTIFFSTSKNLFWTIWYSLSQLVRWMGEKAEELGVEIYPGFAASEVFPHLLGCYFFIFIIVYWSISMPDIVWL